MFVSVQIRSEMHWGGGGVETLPCGPSFWIKLPCCFSQEKYKEVYFLLWIFLREGVRIVMAAHRKQQITAYSCVLLLQPHLSPFQLYFSFLKNQEAPHTFPVSCLVWLWQWSLVWDVIRMHYVFEKLLTASHPSTNLSMLTQHCLNILSMCWTSMILLAFKI